MRTLIITDLTGGDLCLQTVDDNGSRAINEMPTDKEAFIKALDWYFCDPEHAEDTTESYDGHPKPLDKPCGEGHKYIVHEFFVQSPVIETPYPMLEADRVIYVHPW